MIINSQENILTERWLQKRQLQCAIYSQPVQAQLIMLMVSLLELTKIQSENENDEHR